MMAEALDLLDIAKHIVHGTFESTFCVVCLSFLDNSSEIISTKMICPENKEYSTALVMNEIFRIEITDHDNYSLCPKCFSDVTLSYKTYSLARKSHQILTTIADSLYNQIENLEISDDLSYPCLVVPNFEEKHQFTENYHETIKENSTDVETATETENFFEFNDNESIISGVMVNITEHEDMSAEEKKKKYKKRAPMSYLQCTRCSVKYKFVTKLISHMKSEHGVDLFVCKVCQHMSEDSNEHIQHMDIHKDVYTCSVCDSTFKRVESLEIHFRKHASDDEPHVCELCGISTRSESALRAHLERIHPRKRFTCHFCGKMYKIEASFDAHIEKHHMWMGGSHKCSICPRSFPSVDRLRKHIQSVHERTPPYGCGPCGQTFHTEDLLRTHLNKHDRRHVCEICNASFTHARSLLWHKRLHRNEKPYACHVCGRRFVSGSRRNQHAVCAHSAPARRCPLCPALFHLNSMVNTHIKRVHLKFPKRRNRCSKFENVTWKTQVVPLQDLSVSLQNDIMELCALDENSTS